MYLITFHQHCMDVVFSQYYRTNRILVVATLWAGTDTLVNKHNPGSNEHLKQAPRAFRHTRLLGLNNTSVYITSLWQKEGGGNGLRIKTQAIFSSDLWVIQNCKCDYVFWELSCRSSKPGWMFGLFLTQLLPSRDMKVPMTQPTSVITTHTFTVTDALQPVNIHCEHQHVHLRINKDRLDEAL